MGIVISPQVAGLVGPEVAATVSSLLRDRHPNVLWQVVVIEDRLVVPPADALDLLESARDRMLEENWDLSVVLTDLPLRHGRRPVLTQVSPLHGVGLVDVPALGAVHVRQRSLEAVVAVAGQLLGYHPTHADAAQSFTTRARQMANDLDDRAEDHLVPFTARVITGNLRLLLGMVRTNRPWTLVVRLSRTLVGAAATGVLTLVASDVWLLASAYGPIRLALLAALAVGAVSATLILGAGLWERPRRPGEREQVVLFNLATATTVAIGVVVFYLALFAVSWLGALLLVEAGALSEVLARPVGAGDYAKLSWLTATLATVGGALGAGLEDDDAVRSAAYTHSD